ncbi:EAL domain-containing protein [Altererythrobacter lutimaris]|uniref:EAL domain-containing protein n=1 Tax=Altererythrobacter lutimaris TaxID=2743979 RepID=A0A850HBC7_9SPHN|nr:EAL domain-containing protein [Altererythrobacter lutimaris]NVE93848.1 EAL domain-containing protein [Altererythrobacter lutimaris]
MAGLLGRLTGGKGKGTEKLAPLCPIKQNDLARRVELLDSFEQAGLGWFWATDAFGRLIYLSKNAISQLGWDEAEIIGRPLTDLLLPPEDEEDSRSERPLKFLLGARNSISQLDVRVAVETTEVWWEIAGKPQFDKNGEFNGYRGSAKDITATRENQRNAERLSQYDSLTGLANRHRMAKRLGATLSAYRNAKRSCALMMLDLDRFKQVNDTLGHPAGDELLKQVAARLGQIIGKRGEIGRLGGDEFQIMLPDIDDRGKLGDLANRVIQMVSQPYSINGARAIIGTSVGIAVAPYDGIEPEELVKAADLALYSAKGSGRGQFRFYSSTLKDSAKHRRNIEEDLRDAMHRDELSMAYQPIVDASTHKVACFEALMRWEHPERGPISPTEFIPIAEDCGLIKKIGTWALETACSEAAQWPIELRVAINVSAVQFANDDFPQTVKNALKKSGISPSRVELEITESVFMGDDERTQRMFKELKNLGVRLALDDFGTGYSSLSYLRKAPFDKIKIDQTFVRGSCEPDNNNAAIISSIVSLADALDMETVAEGVETKDELELVKKRKATHLQGAIFSFGVPHDEVMAKLESGDLVYEPRGPERYRSQRRTELRRIGLVHGDYRYNVVLKNLSKSGARVEGLLDVPLETEVVLDLGDGQLAVATVVRSEGFAQGLQFETPLISDGFDGLCTRHRVSPYQIEAAGKPLSALPEDAYSALAGLGTAAIAQPQFREVDISVARSEAA